VTGDPSNVSGTVDRDGRLLSADPRLLALQLAAGGDADGFLAIPQLASLARLARTLGIVVSRGVVAADGDVDLDLWVRAQPEGDAIRLAIAGWTERPKPARSSAYLAARAKELAELGGDGVWTTDAALRLTTLDGRLEQMLQMAWKGQRLTNVLRLDPDAAGDFPFLNAVLDGAPFSGQQASFGEDEVGKLWLHGERDLSEDGTVKGYRGGFRWAFAAPELAASENLAGENDPKFSARLDTALRRPLGRIIASADEIAAQEDGALREDYAGYAGDIALAGRHLLGLVDDLSDLQAVERPGFVVETEPLDLADVARRAASLLGVRAADRNVQIDPPDTDETLWAKADFRRALQIMVNLVGNAVRYSPPDGMVWIRAEEEGDIVALIVADQGKGIALDDQERIFEKFERVDTSEPGGSGLGLYISRQLARAMGGDISVDSAPGLGARFVLTLPAADQAIA
jgi:Histidine kinase-, DNA gyrase B-, and HSP90-like ATPase